MLQLYDDLQMSNIKMGEIFSSLKLTMVNLRRNKMLVQNKLCNNIPKIEDIMPEEVKEWMECDKLDKGFDILNDNETVSKV